MGVRTGGVHQQTDDGALARASRVLLLVTIIALPLMHRAFRMFGLEVMAPDLVFVPLALAWAAAVVAGQAPLRWGPGQWVIAVYVAALSLSVAVSADPFQSVVKLATQFYLAGLAVIASSLIRDSADLRRALLAWLAATAGVIAVGAISLILFWADPDNPILLLTQFHFGTLPPGPYPRLSFTFFNANMACNYLTASLAILLATRGIGWIGPTAFRLLLAGIALSAALTISPGIGGLVLLGGLWLRLLFRGERPKAARTALIVATAVASLFVAALAVTPILHPTAPFLIEVPGTNLVVAPSGRMMTWMAAAREFIAHPLLGSGIGTAPITVIYLSPSGVHQGLVDAHNTFLQVAMQAGLVGLAGLILLIGYVFQRTRPFRILPGQPGVLRLALGLGFLVTFVYEGLGGSFEDARHLWLLLGLFFAGLRIEQKPVSAAFRGIEAGQLRQAV